MCLRTWIMKSTADYFANVASKIKNADSVIVGAGAGLSTSAGIVYSGARFQNAFADFIAKFNIKDMYSAAFYPYPDLETFWAYWSRHIMMNRYDPIQKNTYNLLLDLISKKDYFVITTNADHCFVRSGFDKSRLFYTQGNYGVWQCSVACHQKTYDNAEQVFKMFKTQNNMRVDSELIPYCPKCGKPMGMNLRMDNTFIEDDGWHKASKNYMSFLEANKNTNVVYLELGIGSNTPGIIKYPFWQFTLDNQNATYININYGQSYAPKEIANQSICINDDITVALENIHKNILST